MTKLSDIIEREGLDAAATFLETFKQESFQFPNGVKVMLSSPFAPSSDEGFSLWMNIASDQIVLAEAGQFVFGNGFTVLSETYPDGYSVWPFSVFMESHEYVGELGEIE